VPAPKLPPARAATSPPSHRRFARLEIGFGASPFSFTTSAHFWSERVRSGDCLILVVTARVSPEVVSVSAPARWRTHSLTAAMKAYERVSPQLFCS
jgi:hypothetical protein